MKYWIGFLIIILSACSSTEKPKEEKKEAPKVQEPAPVQATEVIFEVEDTDSYNITKVSLNQNPLPYQASDKKAQYTYYLNPGFYHVDWEIIDHNYTWPKTLKYHSTIKIKPSQIHIKIVIRGNEIFMH